MLASGAESLAPIAAFSAEERDGHLLWRWKEIKLHRQNVGQQQGTSRATVSLSRKEPVFIVHFGKGQQQLIHKSLLKLKHLE